MSFPIELNRVCVKFDGDPILIDIGFRIRAGETICLLGPSGCGKTTLLKVMAGLVEPSEGEVLYDRVDIYRTSEKKYLNLQRKTGYVFQDGALLANLSLFENLALPIRYHTRTDEGVLKDRVERVAAAFHLQNRLHLRPAALSGGALRMAGVARTLVTDPEVIFFDDPTGVLDKISAEIVRTELKKRITSGTVTTVISSGDIALARDLADRVILLYDGRIINKGTLDEILQTDDPFIKGIIESIEQSPNI